MKRCLIFLTLVFLFFIISGVKAELTGETVTGEAAQNVALNITVTGPFCGDGSCNGAETCSSCSSDCGACPAGPTGGGGGGGAAAPTKKVPAFEVDKELIKVNIKVGETFETSLKIDNLDTQKLDFKAESNLEEFIILSEEEFSIDSKQSKEIFLTFYSTEDTQPGVYVGEIKITSGSATKNIPVILEIESKKILFDVTLDIPPKYKEVYAGEDLLLQLTIFNLGDLGKTDVFITYLIKDFEGKTILTQEDIISVETQASLSRTIKLPSDLAPGDYVAGVQAKYDDLVGTSSDIFRIKARESILYKYLPYILFFLILLIIIIIIIIFKRAHRKLEKSVTSYKRRKGEESKKAIEKLQMDKRIKDKINALEKAYAEGHISKEAYIKGKERIKKLLGNQKREYL